MSKLIETPVPYDVMLELKNMIEFMPEGNLTTSTDTISKAITAIDNAIKVSDGWRDSYKKKSSELTAANQRIKELEEALHLQNRRLAVYVRAVNQIDDYFEYQMESKKDQKKVHQILGNLTDSLPT